MNMYILWIKIYSEDFILLDAYLPGLRFWQVCFGTNWSHMYQIVEQQLVYYLAEQWSTQAQYQVGIPHASIQQYRPSYIERLVNKSSQP